MDSKTKPHGSNLRAGRYSEFGQIYLITTNTYKKVPKFLDFKCARQLINTIKDSDEKGNTKTLCWVLMPDHLHWLFELKQSKSISTVVKQVKGSFSRTQKDSQKFWQPGFHDRAIRREENLKSVARYIVSNPIRAKLVKSVGDYPHWDCIWM